MKRTVMLFLCVFPLFSLSAQNEWTLQPWVQVYGTVNGESLGKFVTGIPANPNILYRGAVSKGGRLGFYTLQSPTDTTIKWSLPGDELLTGDLNNDGWMDLVVGKRVNDYDTVYVYWGTATGVDTLSPLRIPGENRFDALIPSCIGDVNNDGKPDLILSAWGWGAGATGKISIFLNPVVSAMADTFLIGDTTDVGLGRTCCIADLNNDGLDDLIIRGNNQSGPQETRYDYINVYWGKAPDSLDLTLNVQMSTYNLNSSGLAAFDANGDGIDDLLWTKRDSGSVRNYIAVHYGGASFNTVASLRLESPDFVGNFGAVITRGGDMNGDGFADIVSSTGSGGGTITSGFVFVFGGGPEIDGLFDAAVGQSTDSRFGTSVAGIGDVNEDGLDDIIVGAPEYDFGTNKGYWGIFLGDTNITVTAVEDASPEPRSFELAQNYPNPFNPTTTIEYHLKEQGTVTLKVYDALGREVRRLVHERQNAGTHSIQWDGRASKGERVPSGVYYYELTAGGRKEARKAVIVK